MVKERDVLVLAKLVDSLESSFRKLQEAHSAKDSGNFNNSKIEILRTQRKILEMINN